MQLFIVAMKTYKQKYYCQIIILWIAEKKIKQGFFFFLPLHSLDSHLLPTYT